MAAISAIIGLMSQSIWEEDSIAKDGKLMNILMANERFCGSMRHSYNILPLRTNPDLQTIINLGRGPDQAINTPSTPPEFGALKIKMRP